MPTDIIMPQMGESIFEGTITKWLKQPGEKVQRDEPLFEISTDKVDAEIPAPASGTLQDIKVQAGATVQVNTVVGTISEEGAAAGAAPPAAAQPPKPAAGGDGRGATQSAAAQTLSAEEPKAAQKIPADLSEGEKLGVERQQQGKVEEDVEGGEQERVRSSPLVRRMAKENNVDLTKVSGSGVGGRITKDDIEAFIAKHGAGAPAAAPIAATPAPALLSAAPAAPATPAVTAPLQPVGGVTPGEVVPMSVMRKKIAEHMVMSKRTSAHVHGIFEVDVTRIVKLRESMKGSSSRLPATSSPTHRSSRAP